MTANLTVYSVSDRTVDADLIRRLAPDAHLGSDDGAITVRWPDVSIRITSMPADRRPEHLQGLVGYLGSRVGGNLDAIRPIVDAVEGVRQVFGFVIEPDFDTGHRTMSLVLSLTNTLEQSFVFANGMLYDAFGKIWFGDRNAPPLADPADLQIIKVPAAVGPTAKQRARSERILGLLASVAVPCYQGHLRWIPDDDEVTLRTAREVAQRVVAMHSIITFGRGRPGQEVVDEIARFDLRQVLSPAEAEFFRTEPMDEAARQRMIWRLEALVPLLWSLGLVETLPWPDAMCDVDGVHDLVFSTFADPVAFESVRLRPAAEILDGLEMVVRQHNALRTLHETGTPVPMNFNWSDPTEMVPVAESLAAPLLAERHHALNWLIRFGDAGWDDVDTPT